MHVSLRVDRVVEAPVGDGCHCHAVLEGLTGVHFKRLQSHESAVRPAPDGDLVSVDILLGSELFGDGDLVMRLPVAHVSTDDAAVLPTEEACTAAVDSDHDVTKSRSDVRLEIDHEAAINFLESRTVVEVEEDRVLFLRIEVRRAALDNVKLKAIDVVC